MLEGIWTPKEYASHAWELWLPSIAITDIDGVYGAIEFYSACKKNDIKPIIGTTLSYVPNNQLKQKNEDLQQVTFLAKTDKGYHNLLELISLASLWAWHERSRFDLGILTEFHDEMFLIFGGEYSPIMSMIKHKKDQKTIVAFLKTFEEHIPRECCLLWLLTQDESDIYVYAHNEMIRNLAKEMAWTVILLTEVKYITSTDQDLFDVWLAVKDGKRVFDDDRRMTTWSHHLMTYEEISTVMLKNWYAQSEIENRCVQTNDVANCCNVEIALWGILFPKYENPSHISSLYEEYKDKLVTKI